MKIFVAPLDWGLGHAARCIPVIQYLLEKNCEVILGADGRPLEFLKKEFPSLECIKIPGYDISYSANGSMILKMAAQIPKILFAIQREHRVLRKIIVEKKIEAVISDNRFGLWSPKIPCAFITHQVYIKSPLGESFLHRLNKKYISKFSECWIPDTEGENYLSGDLSHQFPLPANAKYIGLLSRFSGNENKPPAVSRNSLLVMLSGPEPQRTVLENILLQQVPSCPRKILFVQGITEKNERKMIFRNVEMVSHLTSRELQNEILSSEIILSRPGYSTIMDLAVLGRKAIFVPTPGQTEQEYLAELLMKRKICFSVRQETLNLKTALEASEHYTGFTKNYKREEYKNAVNAFMLSVK